MTVEERLKAVLDNKHVILSWLVTHAGVIITTYKMVHDGKAASLRIKNKRPSNNMQPFGERRVDDNEAGIESSIRSSRRYRSKK